jgi:hypothetical protein
VRKKATGDGVAKGGAHLNRPKKRRKVDRRKKPSPKERDMAAHDNK